MLPPPYTPGSKWRSGVARIADGECRAVEQTSDELAGRRCSDPPERQGVHRVAELQLVGRSIATRGSPDRGGSGDGLLLEGQIGVQADLGGVGLLMTQPLDDDGGIDAGVDEPHRGTVTQAVSRDLLVAQALVANVE